MIDQKLSEREKFLMIKYVGLIDRYFRMSHASPQEHDDYYAVAAYGLACGVHDVDEAAEKKTFIDDNDRERYYESFILSVIRNRVIDMISHDRSWSRGGRAVHISTADELSPCSDSEDGGTVEDLLSDITSDNEFKAIEDREYIKIIMQRCTPHQQAICRYIANGYSRKEISERMNVTVKHIGRELAKIRDNNPEILAEHTKRRKIERSIRNNITVSNGKYIIEISIKGKSHKIYNADPDKVEVIRDELRTLREKDPTEAIRRIKEINEEIRSRKQYKNPRNIRKSLNYYVVRLSIDGVMESVGLIPTLEEAIMIRDNLIAARKLGFDKFYIKLEEFRKRYNKKSQK